MDPAGSTRASQTINKPPNYDNKTALEKTRLFFNIYWRTVVIVVWPLALLPILVLYYESKPVRCAYVVMLMAMFWMTESLPLAVTSLLPLFLFPLLGILDSQSTCVCYMNDTIMVFLGGFMLAISVEHSGLHLRIALGVMMLVGCTHRKLLASLLLVIFLLGMWVSNTACCAMMVPIMFAVLYELEEEGLGKVFEVDPEDPLQKQIPTTVTRGYLLAAAYASTFAGTSTIVGTGTNLSFKGIFESTFPQSSGINFSQWMLHAMPQALINIFLTYIYILVFYMGLGRPNSQQARDSTIGPEGEIIVSRVIEQKFKNLGPLSYHEIFVAVVFVLCIVLWFFRQPGFCKGWADYLPEVAIRDSAPVLLVVVLMFVIPKDLDFLHICDKDANKRPIVQSEGLITWKVVEQKIPWGLLFLLGGGFAIAKGSNASGLSKKIGKSMTVLETLPPFAIMCVTCFFTSTFTELTSNIGFANIVLPVIAQMSVTIKVNPLYLMVPATLICSYAFRLPVGTPPNAIITISGRMPVKYLMKGGCLPSLYACVIVIITFQIWGKKVYNITEEFPSWAMVNA